MAPNKTQGPVPPSAANGGFSGTSEVPTKTPREAAELGAMMRRMLAALGRRAASGDLEALVVLNDLDRQVPLQLKRAALALNHDHGYSWSQIALRLGISKRAVIGRWVE